MPIEHDLPLATSVASTDSIRAVVGGASVLVPPSVLVRYTGVYTNARQFGARGDGVHNDTSAIQAAINEVGAAGGGTVFIPAGIYRIQPPEITTGHAIGIPYNNITVCGEAGTVISFYLYDGSNPATHWPLVNGAVLRGRGIQLLGNVSNVVLDNFELIGNAGNTGDRSFPASPITGDGWDITNQGIKLGENTTISNITVCNVNVHTWRGEPVYYGGAGADNINIINFIVGNTNGDGISVSSKNGQYRNGKIYSCYNNGIENTTADGEQVYNNIEFDDCLNGGAAIFPVSSSGAHGLISISELRFKNCTPYGLSTPGAINYRIWDIVNIDCDNFGLDLSSEGTGGSGTDMIQMGNVEVYNIRTYADKKTIDSGIYLGTSSSFPAQRLHIRDCDTLVTADAAASGKTFRRALNVNENLSFDVGTAVRIERIYGFGGTQEDHSNANVTSFPLTDTSLHTVASIKQARPAWLMRVTFSWEIDTAPTNLEITVLWNDPNGNPHSETIITGSQAVGFGQALWQGVIGSQSANQLQVQAQAGTANRAAISVNISGM